MLILEHKQVNPFSNGEKLSKFCNTYFFNKRMWNFLAFLGKKLKRLVPQTWNFVRRPFGSCNKKTKKTKKLWRQPFTVNFTFEIYKYFPNIFITWMSKHIWILFLRAMVNWSPQFYSHPFRSLFELQLIFWQSNYCSTLFSTRTQIWIESETVKEMSSK